MPYPHGFTPRIETIEDHEVRQMADHILGEMKLSVLKGVAHEIDSSKYPLSRRSSSVESATIAFVQSHKKKKRKQIKKSVGTLLKQQPQYLANLFGPLAKVDLKSKKTVSEQIQRLGLHKNNRISTSSLSGMNVRGTRLVRASSYRTVNTNIFETVHGKFDFEDRPGLHLTDPIREKYRQLGRKAGFLGKTVGTQGACGDGRGRYQNYEHGSIYWSAETGAHEVHGAILRKWTALGKETSFLGYPLTDEKTTPDGIGRYNHFQHGSIYWTPDTGAHEIHGAIRAKWAEKGWEKCYLGYPVTDERKTPDTIGRYTHFQGGSIYWTPTTNAHDVHKSITDKWSDRGWELGYLGYPISDTVTYMHPSSMACRFQGGEITWSAGSGASDRMPFSKLRFRIHKVKCIDETNPEWPGGDEIDLGGVACSINNGKTSKINAYRVSSDFDDGEQVVYGEPRPFHTFDLKKIPGWAKSFTVTMALAEIDSGGFNDFLRKMLKLIRDKVISLIKDKAAALTGAALGAYLGAAAGVIGAVVGALVGWVLGELFDWIDTLFEDDVFPVFTAQFSLPNDWFRWGAHTDSPQGNFRTWAHGGEYQVWFDWQLLP